MIEEDKFVCDFCGEEINKEDNQAYTDNGVETIGEDCICEFCYLNLKEVW